MLLEGNKEGNSVVGTYLLPNSHSSGDNKLLQCSVQGPLKRLSSLLYCKWGTLGYHSCSFLPKITHTTSRLVHKEHCTENPCSHSNLCSLPSISPSSQQQVWIRWMLMSLQSVPDHLTWFFATFMYPIYYYLFTFFLHGALCFCLCLNKYLKRKNLSTTVMRQKMSYSSSK